MSAKVHSTPDNIAPVKSSSSSPEPKPGNSKINSQTKIESVKCDCCGLAEECTPSYIAKIRDRYGGSWICGLCSEAVKEDIVRSDKLITTEEALNRHKRFRSSLKSPSNHKESLISAVRRLLRRSLDSPSAVRPPSPSSSTG